MPDSGAGDWDLCITQEEDKVVLNVQRQMRFGTTDHIAIVSRGYCPNMCKTLLLRIPGYSYRCPTCDSRFYLSYGTQERFTFEGIDSGGGNMAYKVLDEDGKPIPNESYESPAAAERSMLILSAHELRNGRMANYRIEPPIDLGRDLAELNLPDWALEELKKHGIE